MRFTNDLALIVDMILLLSIVCFSNLATAGTYHVANGEKGASDNNNGLHATYKGGKNGSWTTIQKALDSVKPGDTILVKKGRYREQIAVTTSGIKLKGFNSNRPVIDGEKIREYGIYVPRSTPVRNLLVEGFEIINQTKKGIFVSDTKSSAAIIRNNVIHHIFEKGIDIYGAKHRIEDNIIYMIGNHQESMGIHLGAVKDCLVQNNDVFLCKKTAIRDQNGQRNIIQSNLMHECWTGLDFNGSSGVKAFNNYIYNNSQGFNPKHVQGHSGWNLFWHNTLYSNDGPHVSIAVNRVSGSTSTEPDCDYLSIQNNIFGRCGLSHLWDRPSIVGEHIVINNNLYYGPRDWPPYFYHTEWPRSGRPGIASIDEMRKRTSFGESAMVYDPRLIDPEKGNLDYTSSSPAAKGAAALESSFGKQLGARGLRRPVTRFVRVPMKAIAASVNEELMSKTTDGRYWTGWHSGEEMKNQWIIYEMQSRRAFTHIILVPAGHQVEYNVRNYEFAVSNDNKRYNLLIRGKNNHSGSTFIYELKKPVTMRYLKFIMIDKFPDDGRSWSTNNLQFDELIAGFCSTSLDAIGTR